MVTSTGITTESPKGMGTANSRNIVYVYVYEYV
jgi:hypothetical protein